MRIKLPSGLITREELKSLRPKDRDEYIQKLLVRILELNSQGVTIGELADQTGINRVTLASHLKTLVATREAYAITRGKLSIFFKNGKVVHARSTEHKFPNDRFYRFYRLENEQGKFIYIQERQLDEFRAVKVKGGIMIHDRDFMKFMKELQKFAMEVTERESKTRC
jgi:DNA-binding transcriptional ArsR family regulator